MNELLIRILYVYITSFACHKGRSYRGCGGTGVPYCPQCLDCRHICRILIALVIFILLIKLKESPLCLQIGLQQGLFVGKSWLCNPSITFFSFAPDVTQMEHKVTRCTLPSSVAFHFPYSFISIRIPLLLN